MTSTFQQKSMKPSSFDADGPTVGHPNNPGSKGRLIKSKTPMRVLILINRVNRRMIMYLLWLERELS